jgi:hypothetical protein
MQAKDPTPDVIGAAALLLLASACSEQPPGPADPAGLQRSTFALGGATFEWLLPQKAVADPRAGDGEPVIIRDLTRSHRLERTLALSGSQTDASAGYFRTITLASGNVLRYRVHDDIGGGSGGTIAELTGALEIGGRTIYVRCADQDELFREPDWCVPHLHHLRIVKPR